MGVRAGFPAQTYSLRSYSPAIPNALHYVTQCIPASSKMTERCSRSRAHGIINFSLSLKMCKDKVGLKYPFINLYQKSLNIRARKRTRTFNNFYYRTPNVYFFPALLFCTSRKKRKKIYFRVLESGLPDTGQVVRSAVRQQRPLSSHPANSSDIETMTLTQRATV